MRLTLRTLLAYLDNTLEPEDAAILREKLEESGFATQLVQRIRQSLTNTELSAPPPDSVHPIAEANVISEYLDSTLTPEQIAEIERACLESEPHLAEAAAVHQILTMVLGKPATATDQLRQRIYLLPEAHARSQPPTGSFSSVSIPSDAGVPTADLPSDASLQPAGKTVPPVGPDDSGVSDAPTRLRATEGEEILASESPPAVAGARQRGRLQVSDVYDGSVRPSRITPWLVSLALAGVLLFVLSQIFAPLLRDTTAQKDPDEDKISLLPAQPPIELDAAEPSGDTDAETDETDQATETATTNESRGAETESASESASADTDPTPPPGTAEETRDVSPDQAASADEMEIEEVDLDQVSEKPVDADAADSASPTEPGDDTPDAPPIDTPSPDKAAAATDQDTGPDPVPMEDKPDSSPPDAPPSSDDVTAKDPTDPPDGDDAADAKSIEPLATLLTERTLLVAQIGPGRWVRVTKDMSMGEQIRLLSAPGFHSEMSTIGGQFVLTLIDASEASWLKDADGEVPGVMIPFGRALITSKAANVATKVNLGGYEVSLTLAEPETVVGIEVRYMRAPGKDPSDPNNHLRVARIFSVQGDIQIKTPTGDETVQTGQQILIKGNDVTPTAAMTPAAWANPPDPNDKSIEAEARDGLLQLLTDGPALSLDLNEATSFRRAEVGALAAQTLLLMGNGTVYFGADGILSDPKQRAYWPKHFKLLRSVVDYSPQSAAALATSITEMDAADGETLFKLLVGYSEKNLVEGGDEDLVEMLESNSMAVRVLAIENLREITGTTLYYRPEEDSAVRRAQATKKWRTRQDKGDIRWNAEQ